MTERVRDKVLDVSDRVRAFENPKTDLGPPKELHEIVDKSAVTLQGKDGKVRKTTVGKLKQG